MLNAEEGAKISRMLDGRICVKVLITFFVMMVGYSCFCSQSYRELFAFSHKRYRDTDIGWSIYDAHVEYARLKLPNGIWKIVGKCNNTTV